MKKIVHEYYRGWIAGDLQASRKLMADDCIFKSVQGNYFDADGFISSCGHLAEGLTDVRYLKEVYTESEAFVILEWHLGPGQIFQDAEYLRVVNGKIVEIIVVNNSPDFGEMLN